MVLVYIHILCPWQPCRPRQPLPWLLTDAGRRPQLRARACNMVGICQSRTRAPGSRSHCRSNLGMPCSDLGGCRAQVAARAWQHQASAPRVPPNAQPSLLPACLLPWWSGAVLEEPAHATPPMTLDPMTAMKLPTMPCRNAIFMN